MPYCLLTGEWCLSTGKKCLSTGEKCLSTGRGLYLRESVVCVKKVSVSGGSTVIAKV